MERPLHARLSNAEGELIVEGACWLDERAGQATLEPEREPGVLRKERGRLTLELESGRTLLVSDRPMIHRIRPPRLGGGLNGCLVRYRLRLIDDAQEAAAAGAAGDGAPAVPSTGRPSAGWRRETPGPTGRPTFGPAR